MLHLATLEVCNRSPQPRHRVSSHADHLVAFGAQDSSHGLAACLVIGAAGVVVVDVPAVAKPVRPGLCCLADSASALVLEHVENLRPHNAVASEGHVVGGAWRAPRLE